jgi:hypothetical protein
MPRSPKGLAIRAAQAFASGYDEEAIGYLEQLRQLCGSGHPAAARRVYVRALLNEMTNCSFGEAKHLNKLHEQLALYLPESTIHRLVAKVFAKQAASEANIIRRSRLYKVACRHAPIQIVAAAFEKRNIRVYCPLNRRHPVERIGATRPHPFARQLATTA